jgi:hypothetical protein
VDALRFAKRTKTSPEFHHKMAAQDNLADWKVEKPKSWSSARHNSSTEELWLERINQNG